MWPISRLKYLCFKRGAHARFVPLGLFRGLTLELDAASHTQVYLGLWERETHPFIRAAARRCRWAVDVGAGRGELCVFLLKHSNARPIVAIEPQAKETDALRSNLDLNGEGGNPSLVVVNKLAGVGANGHLALDALDLDRRQPGFIKIDVDGAELSVLNSGQALLRQSEVDILVETHSRELEAGVIELLRRWGYDCHVIHNAWWRSIIPEYRPCAHNRWLWATKSAVGSRRQAVGSRRQAAGGRQRRTGRERSGRREDSL